jgi:hypothetical protein
MHPFQESVDAEVRLEREKAELLKVLKETARECGLQAGVASAVDDTHGIRVWSELQNKLDAILRKYKDSLE